MNSRRWPSSPISVPTTGARLVVDEAHGLGVLGKEGRGAAESSGVLHRVDAVTVALSKCLASVGGAIMTSRAAAEGIRASAMPYVFSAANDPASVAAALTALRILRSEPERVAALQDNCALLRRALTENGTPPVPGAGAVLAVPTGADEVTGPAWKAAFAAGVYTNAVTYPAVPRGHGVLRLTLMATHTPEQLLRAGAIVCRGRAHRAGDPAGRCRRLSGRAGWAGDLDRNPRAAPPRRERVEQGQSLHRLGGRAAVGQGPRPRPPAAARCSPSTVCCPTSCTPRCCAGPSPPPSSRSRRPTGSGSRSAARGGSTSGTTARCRARTRRPPSPSTARSSS